MAYEQAYVFASAADGRHQWVGTIKASQGAGSFQYSEPWLAGGQAYALDPVNLPLSSKSYRALNRYGLFGVFRDAAPDDWGRRIMLLNNRHAPANELERLLRTSGGGVGCLRFSLSRKQVKDPAVLPTMARIQALAEAAEKLEARQALAPEELALIEPGSSMGGARPKVTVTDGDARWLVKFSKTTDLVDVPLLEYCCMQFLQKEIGLNIPQTRLIKLADQHAFAIKRFDNGKHFISANSLFNQDRIRILEDSSRNPYSYCNLAGIIRKHCAEYKEDCSELFKRMLANIVMGNTDDHARNHALIYNVEQGKWLLSPAYDMLPIVATQTRVQAMGVGRYGPNSTVENALSYANLFGLKSNEAKGVAEQVLKTFHLKWIDFCAENGMSEMDCNLVERVMLR